MADSSESIGPAPEVVPEPPGIFEPGSQFSDTSKLQALLPDYAPRDLVAGLHATIPWYLTHLQANAAEHFPLIQESPSG